MVIAVIVACGKDPSQIVYRGDTLDFTSPWRRISFRQVLIEEANFDIEAFDGRDTLAKAAIARGVPVEKR